MRPSQKKALRAASRVFRRIVRRLTASARRAEIRRLVGSTPPDPRPRDPETVAWVVAGPWLRAGLAWQWTQVVPAPGAEGDTGGPAPHVALVEVAGGLTPGWAGTPEELARSVADLAARGVPLVVWDTGTAGETGPDAVTRHARAVLVADPARVEDWRVAAPHAEVDVLLAGVELRLAPPTGPAERRLAVGVLPMRAAGREAPSGRGLRTKAGRAAADVWRLGSTTGGAGPTPDLTADRLGALLGRYGACLTDDAWAAVAAAASQTPVIWEGDDAVLPPAVAAICSGARADQGAVGAVQVRVKQGELRDRDGLVLHRAVLGGHTLADRTDSLLAAAGMPRPAVNPATVSAVVPTNREHELENTFANLGRQAHERTELVLVLHGLDVSDADVRSRATDSGVENLTIVRAGSELTLGTCMNLGVDAAAGDYVAKMDDDNYYGPHYLTDLLGAFQYTDAGIVGKLAHYVWLRSSGAVVLRYPTAEHTYERRIQGGSMLFDQTVVRELRFSDIPRGVDSDILDRAIAAGIGIYSADRFNFVSVRGLDRTAHTWPVEDSRFLTGNGVLVFYGDPRPHVSV